MWFDYIRIMGEAISSSLNGSPIKSFFDLFYGLWNLSQNKIWEQVLIYWYCTISATDRWAFIYMVSAVGLRQAPWIWGKARAWFPPSLDQPNFSISATSSPHKFRLKQNWYVTKSPWFAWWLNVLRKTKRGLAEQQKSSIYWKGGQNRKGSQLMRKPR